MPTKFCNIDAILNAISLVFGFLPAVAGIKMGYDSAETICKNENFQVACAVAMFINMWSTRSEGMIPVFFEPFIHLHKALTDSDLTQDEIKKFALSCMPQGLRPETTSCREIIDAQADPRIKAYHRWLYLAYILKIPLSVLMIFSLPMWLQVSENSWKSLLKLDSETPWELLAIGTKTVVWVTAITNLAFYIKQAFSFFDDIICGYLVPKVLIGCNNTKRVLWFLNLIAGGLAAFFSGASMGFEAKEVSSTNQLYPWVLFIDKGPIEYSELIWSCAAIINYRSFCNFFSEKTYAVFCKFSSVFSRSSEQTTCEKVGIVFLPSLSVVYSFFIAIVFAGLASRDSHWYDGGVSSFIMNLPMAFVFSILFRDYFSTTLRMCNPSTGNPRESLLGQGSQEENPTRLPNPNFCQRLFCLPALTCHTKTANAQGGAVILDPEALITIASSG